MLDNLKLNDNLNSNDNYNCHENKTNFGINYQTLV